MATLGLSPSDQGPSEGSEIALLLLIGWLNIRGNFSYVNPSTTIGPRCKVADKNIGMAGLRRRYTVSCALDTV